MERVARVGVPDLHAGAGRLCSKQPPCLEDVCLAKTPFAVGVRCRIVRALATRRLDGAARRVLGCQIAEHRIRIGDFRLIAQRVRQLPRASDGDTAWRRQQLDLGTILEDWRELPSRELYTAHDVACEGRCVPTRCRLQYHRQRFDFGLSSASTE